MLDNEQVRNNSYNWHPNMTTNLNVIHSKMLEIQQVFPHLFSIRTSKFTSNLGIQSDSVYDLYFKYHFAPSSAMGIYFKNQQSNRCV